MASSSNHLNPAHSRRQFEELSPNLADINQQRLCSLHKQRSIKMHRKDQMHKPLVASCSLQNLDNKEINISNGVSSGKLITFKKSDQGCEQNLQNLNYQCHDSIHESLTNFLKIQKKCVPTEANEEKAEVQVMKKRQSLDPIMHRSIKENISKIRRSILLEFRSGYEKKSCQQIAPLLLNDQHFNFEKFNKMFKKPICKGIECENLYEIEKSIEQDIIEDIRKCEPDPKYNRMRISLNHKKLVNLK